ncbi:LPXTG-motif cell wall anchor domain-containing protein [Micromonospora citrea]|uniref:LPXTG-motif cell wall anchor domain-containing protein n=1 Tax=Micromonospora citrea TaxID=47855 RepID=A0A1C6UZ73_9ACTN|nr:LPXTG cell wall anchor domain-containing protein [Micromonospora citrea]SCL59321.1 LPXTG-motif cell wall anchor domain-containing protein [Micromonospora citrea]
MFKHSTRRSLAGLGVAGALLAASATPAVAEEPGDELLLYANNALVAPGGEAKSVTLYAFAEALPERLTLTIDRDGVDGFAAVVLGDRLSGCKEAGAVITCTLDGTEITDYLVNLTVTARDAAAPGDKGELVLSVAAKGMPTATARSTVEVGEGVDLKTERSLELTGDPGATVKAPLSVANVGDRPARGTVLLLASTPGLAPARRHSNCSYLSGFGSNLAQCHFDEELPPGAALQLDDSSALTIASDAWAPGRQYGQAIWFAKGDWAEFIGDFSDAEWEKGSGSALRLVPAPASRARAVKQTDKDTTNNVTWIDATVTGDQRADVAATGAEVTGAAGATVVAKVGFVNNGPAAINSYGPGELLTGALVTVPAGATVVKAPDVCSPGTAEEPTGSYGEPGGRVYFCEWFELRRKGEAAVFEFGLRIDEVGGAPGSVRLLHFGPDEPGKVADLDPKNDIAALTIKGATGGEGGGGEDPELPITGESTGLIAGIGGLLLVAGIGGYVVAKRRRTRFVA